MEAHDDETLLTPSEVAAMFRVNPKTVTRWARAGKISAIRTLGGHRRVPASQNPPFLGQGETRSGGRAPPRAPDAGGTRAMRSPPGLPSGPGAAPLPGPPPFF